MDGFLLNWPPLFLEPASKLIQISWWGEFTFVGTAAVSPSFSSIFVEKKKKMAICKKFQRTRNCRCDKIMVVITLSDLSRIYGKVHYWDEDEDWENNKAVAVNQGDWSR